MIEQTRIIEKNPTAFFQIWDTITFEFEKNLKKVILALIIAAAMVIFGYILAASQYAGEIDEMLTSTSFGRYLLNYLNIYLYIIICAIAGSSICADFEKDTKNLLFPNIGRGRLFIGRLLALTLMQILIILIYFLFVFGFVGYVFKEIPKELFISMAWAFLFGEALVCFVMFFSSLMKTVTATVVVSFMLLFLGFDIISGIMSFTTDVEPLMLLTYYSQFITASINLPDPRYMNQVIESAGITLELHIWYTPSMQGYLIGLLVHIAVFLGLTAILFKRRQ
jgi:ABC-type transport system involved in multi-copper enzyme maturation permease subunit